MKYFGLVWKSLWRKKVRTGLTILSVLVAFLLYGLLMAVGYAFRGGVDLANADRLVTINKITLINPLPYSQLARIRATPGVEAVTHATWFGGYFQDERNLFAQFPVAPESYLEMYPELELPEAQREAWLANRTGAVVGRPIAERFGWEVGDRVPIYSSIWTQKDGSQSWEFDIEGIVDAEDARGNTALMLFHYDYFDEARAFGDGTVGWYVLRVADGADPVAVANAIDEQFANSPNQTETSTEAAFAESFAKQFGNIALIITLIIGAVFFTLLLVSGTTMAQSVRERISELAVLKTLGFKDRTVMGIVLGESVLLIAIGGLAGLALSWLLSLLAAEALATLLPGLWLSPLAIALGVGLMVLAGIAAGIFPALRALRLTIVDALAHG